MKAIILARVSTKEQEEGHSVNAQVKRLQEYCLRKDFEVIRTYEIVESSTRGERKEFNQLLEFAKSQKETIAIVADAVDRIQRSFKESVLLDELIRAEQIELHFYRENMVIGKEASSTDIMRWDFSVMGAKSYVLQLSENVKRSLEFKKRNGEWCNAAPIGYINTKHEETGKSWIIPDPERKFHIKKIFNEYATGAYSLNEIAAMANNWGLRTIKGKKVYASQIHHIIQSPFYYGIMIIKGESYPHKYEPLISKEIYDKCQEVRTRATRTQTPRQTKKPFVFRGLLKCAVSGRVVTSDLKKCKYTYLICYDPKNPKKKLFIPESKIIKQISEVFKSISIPEHVLELVEAHLKESHKAEIDFHHAAIENLEVGNKNIQGKLDRLLDLYLDKSITEDRYYKKKEELEEDLLANNVRLSEHYKGDSDFKNSVSALFSLSSKAYELFNSSNIEQKRKLIGFVFSNLKLNGSKLEYSLNKPFDALANFNNHTEWLALVNTLRTDYYKDVMLFAKLYTKEIII